MFPRCLERADHDGLDVRASLRLLSSFTQVSIFTLNDKLAETTTEGQISRFDARDIQTEPTIVSIIEAPEVVPQSTETSQWAARRDETGLCRAGTSAGVHFFTGFQHSTREVAGATNCTGQRQNVTEMHLLHLRFGDRALMEISHQKQGELSMDLLKLSSCRTYHFSLARRRRSRSS